MITLCRADSRHSLLRRKHQVWRSFHADAGELATGFDALEVLDEDHLAPSATIWLRPDRDVEILTYVLEGALACDDSSGRSGVVHAGEFQLLTTRRGGSHSQTNASRTESARVFHLWLRPAQAALDAACEHKRFYAADRRGVLCVVVSSDGRRGSLRIHQDAVIYSSMLEPGQHLVHELASQHRAWLHVVRGELTLGDHLLTTGDGAGIADERAVSLTAKGATEVLLLDLHATNSRTH